MLCYSVSIQWKVLLRILFVLARKKKKSKKKIKCNVYIEIMFGTHTEMCYSEELCHVLIIALEWALVINRCPKFYIWHT